jgi:hypothetical protein
MKRLLFCSLPILLLIAVLAALATAPAAPAAAVTGNTYTSILTVNITGTAGSATGSLTSPDSLNGTLRAVLLDYPASISTTTDLLLTTVSPVATILSLTNTYTDNWYYPGVQLYGNTGSGLSAYVAMPIDDYVTVTVSQSTSSTMTIYLIWGD